VYLLWVMGPIGEDIYGGPRWSEPMNLCTITEPYGYVFL